MSLDLRSPLAPPATTADRLPPARGRITARAILLALAIIPCQMHWIGLVEGVWHGLHMTCLSLPMAPLFLLLVLMVANLGLQRLWPRAVLTQAELLTIFAMLALSAFLCGHDRLINLMGTVAYAHRFATPENRWEELFFAYLPDWFVVKDREAAFHYYAGGSSYALYWRHWVKPAIGWSSFTVVVVATLLCLNVVMRKRWTEAERLSYPIIQIPLAMTDPRFPFWRSAPLWIGFGLAGGVDLLNGIAYLYPSVPNLPYYGAAMDLKPYLVNHPWNAIDYLRADFYPFMLGIAYFLPMDIIFSTWFFYLVGRLQMVWGGATGLRELLPRYPYFGMQAAGAVLVGCAVTLGLLAGASVVLGVGQRIGLIAALPPVAYTAGTYAAGAAGSWVAGRLSRRRGALVGLAVAVAVGAVALWAGSAVPSPPDPGEADQARWVTVAVRMLLAAAVFALAGALGVGP